MSLLDTLDELYASGNAPTVPDIDTGVRERARARREERPKERERDRERDRDRERERERDREREREREPLRKEARDSDTATLSPAAEAVVRRRRLIGAGLGAVVVALVVLLATGTFSSSSKKKSSSARTTTTAAQTQIIGRIPLTPAKSGVKASGNAFILQRGTQRVLVVQAKLPPLRQLADFVRVLPGEVSRLGAVRREVVQLPGPFPTGGDQLPVAHPDGSVAFVLPPEVVVSHRAIMGEGRHEALPGRRHSGWERAGIRK